ncbi:DUF4260 domain-containing protein [Frigidibacter sp. ROC022]|uniref:DUF4260 domain-containing protein n=1 Tax=Frigidibacter sp. ROC022 TaxID=2971796 RepID=UPI00215A19B9|nr:DUF4260 domain-containing protein [Frigidibacter sp. ROC022]MCR8726278.1 DUF4260 domain-containing protein [Frigidibacter sp. ROC022]
MTRLLRAEAAVLALVLLAMLVQIGPPWWLWVLVLVTPDLSLFGYLRGPRQGAVIYNLAHSSIGPALLGLVSILAGPAPLLSAVAMLWGLHVAVDRALGYGLKHRTVFRDTHLGRIGR